MIIITCSFYGRGVAVGVPFGGFILGPPHMVFLNLFHASRNIFFKRSLPAFFGGFVVGGVVGVGVGFPPDLYLFTYATLAAYVPLAGCAISTPLCYLTHLV
jgi:ABC-type nitrate/sulfonate/bicarbonate transport system permease component